MARDHLLRRGALAAACGTWAYLRLVRPWRQRWGATDDEVRRPLPGDEEIPKPTIQSTRAITIAAPPQDVWPWIAQIGYVAYGRAGWYAFDFWDANAGRGRSSWRLLPEAQQLQVGLRIGEEGFRVRSFELNQHLVLAYHYPQVEWVLKEGALAEVRRMLLGVRAATDQRSGHTVAGSHQVHPGRARRPPAVVAVL